MRLHLSLYKNNKIINQFISLNEVNLHRINNNLINVDLFINNDKLTQVIADGLFN